MISGLTWLDQFFSIRLHAPVQYCCTVRGHYMDSTSETGCNFQHVTSDNFFYHVPTDQTFQDCYEGEEVTTTVPNAGLLWGLDVPVIGPQRAQIPSTNVVRDWAIIGDASHEGAYEFNIGEQDDLRLVYFTGAHRHWPLPYEWLRRHDQQLRHDRTGRTGGGRPLLPHLLCLLRNVVVENYARVNEWIARSLATRLNSLGASVYIPYSTA